MLYGIVGQEMRQVTRQRAGRRAAAVAGERRAALDRQVDPAARCRAEGDGRGEVHLRRATAGNALCRQVVCPWPHARVMSIDTSAAERYPGVRAVHVLETLLQSAQASRSGGRGRQRLSDRALRRPDRRRGRGRDAARSPTRRRSSSRSNTSACRMSLTSMRRWTDDAPLVFPGPVEQPATAGGGGAPRRLAAEGQCARPNFGRPGHDAHGRYRPGPGARRR